MSVRSQSTDQDIIILEPDDVKPLITHKIADPATAQRDARIAALIAQNAEIEAKNAQLQAAMTKSHSKTARKPEPVSQDHSDSASDTSDNEGSTIRIKRSEHVKASRPKGSQKTRMATGILKRECRSMCRILSDYGVNEAEIAEKYNRTVEYIKRIIQNDTSVPDDLDKDYDFVDEEIKAKYPPLLKPQTSGGSVSKVKRRRESDSDRRAHKHKRSEVKPRQIQSAPPKPKLEPPPRDAAVLKFLQGLEPNMDRLFPKFQAESFDDEMLQSITSWPDDEINELLGEWTKAGVLGIAQRFIFKKGLIRLRAAKAV